MSLIFPLPPSYIFDSIFLTKKRGFLSEKWSHKHGAKNENQFNPSKTQSLDPLIHFRAGSGLAVQIRGVLDSVHEEYR